MIKGRDSEQVNSLLSEYTVNHSNAFSSLEKNLNCSHD